MLLIYFTPYYTGTKFQLNEIFIKTKREKILVLVELFSVPVTSSNDQSFLFPFIFSALYRCYNAELLNMKVLDFYKGSDQKIYIKVKLKLTFWALLK